MKNVYISTYCHWTSFGSMLQSLGLQYVLKEIGTNPKTITFSEDDNIPAIKKFQIRLNKNAVNYFYQLYNKQKLENGRKLCLQFIEENIRRVCLKNNENMEQELNKADVYLAGSDQIWHPVLCREDFFLQYAPDDRKKISYAASMGVLDIPTNNVKKFSKLLQNFDSFSVREKEMIPIIKKYTNKSIYHHVDPTFLVSAYSWREYSKSYDIDESYILVYALYWDRSFNQKLKELHEKTGYKIVSIQNSLRPIYANKRVMDIGPKQFLWLMDHAEAVVTSSFHGTAFSVIFNKRFYPIINPSSPSRIAGLIKMLKVKVPQSIDELMDYETNYDLVNNYIKKEKNRSLEYLRREIYGE